MKLDNTHNTSHGFKTPDQYFERFDERLVNALSKAPLDKDIPSGFETPKGYFDTIDDTIIDQTKSKSKIIPFRPNPKLYYIVGVAASLILLLAIFINTEKTSEISAEMVEIYFQESDLNSYELAELLSEADMLEEDFLIIETDYSEDSLESYLLDNSDIEQLLQ